MKKNILVIGAGSGIGRALFELLNTLPEFRAFGISRRGIPFQKTQMIDSGVNYKCDLTNEKEIVSFFEFYQHSFKDIHAIYLCQGDGLRALIKKI